MNREPSPIDLAEEPDFTLGGARVRPALRRFAASGTDEMIEPRVMQALVALARHTGAVLGRDELVALCWAGRAVSEDAVQRAIGKVRRLGETSGAFAIETIPRVGYRLAVQDDGREDDAAGAIAERKLTQAAGLMGSPPRDDARPSIAVLPFLNRSEQPGDEVVADTAADDMAVALSANRKLKVIVASGTANPRNPAGDVRQIGQDLAVRYLLQGNLRRTHEDDLRVTVQLVEAERGHILWTEKFDHLHAQIRPPDESFWGDVTLHVGVQIERAEMEHALRQRGDVTDWEAAMRYQAHIARLTRAGWETMAAEAVRAIEASPSNGRHRAALAAAQSQLLSYRGLDDPELKEQILGNVRAALTLDPDNPNVLAGVTSALATLGNLAGALVFAERGVAIRPNLESVHLALGSVLVRLNRFDQAFAELDAAERLAPNSHWLYYSLLWRSVAHTRSGRLDLALDAVERSLRLFHGTPSLIQAALCLAKSERAPEARDAFRRFRELEPDMSQAHIENLVRYFYFGSDTVDDNTAVVRTLWNEGEY